MRGLKCSLFLDNPTQIQNISTDDEVAEDGGGVSGWKQLVYGPGDEGGGEHQALEERAPAGPDGELEHRVAEAGERERGGTEPCVKMVGDAFEDGGEEDDGGDERGFGEEFTERHANLPV